MLRARKRPAELSQQLVPATRCPRAEPYTMSVRKRASRMSMAATDFAMRSMGGKAHVR